MSTNCSESSFLIHISLFTIENGYLAIYGIVSNHSCFFLASDGWLPHMSHAVHKYDGKKREGIEVNRPFWMATSGPHV